MFFFAFCCTDAPIPINCVRSQIKLCAHTADHMDNGCLLCSGPCPHILPPAALHLFCICPCRVHHPLRYLCVRSWPRCCRAIRTCRMWAFSKGKSCSQQFGSLPPSSRAPWFPPGLTKTRSRSSAFSSRIGWRECPGIACLYVGRVV